MVDDEYKDDEYQFTESDIDPAFDNEALDSSESASMRTSGEGRLKQVILVGIGLVLAVSAVYKFIALERSGGSPKTSVDIPKQQASSKKQRPTKVVSTKPTAPAIPSKPVVTQTAIPRPQVQTVTRIVTDKRIKAKIDALQDASTTTSQKVSQLGDAIEQLQDGLGTLGHKLTEVSSNLTMINEQLRRQQESIQRLQHPPKKLLGHAKPMPPPLYFIQALIPGRAWLVSPRGAMLTVIEGTQLKGYGRIKQIDAKHNQIITTSGRIIQFRREDT